MKNIARILHLLACEEKHGDMPGVIVDECNWYLEEQMETCWEEQEHEKWLSEAEVFLAFFEDNEEKAHRTLTSLMDICSKISFLMKNCVGMETLILKIIKKTLVSS
ncbi:hypothetical protein LCGC14_1724530 [marine sediment metagenome]|uniref:Uncharacterized protein n=1 Tax=marine sediment metagenome TaxID=412755 RepID=A0A0F9HBG7_9ZZZZ